MGKNETIFIGITGGTASGKTTVVKKIMKHFKDKSVVDIKLDSYYNVLAGLSDDERAKVNFDHPKAFDFDLLYEQLDDLKKGKTIEKPIYDFTTHLRKDETETVKPARIVIVEGILVFIKKEIRDLLDMKIFVDTASDIRLIRRIERDIAERGRTFDTVKNQYFETVRPMHIQFIEPTKQNADIIVPKGGRNTVAINMIISRIHHLLEN